MTGPDPLESLRIAFPSISERNAEITSPYDRRYNCRAHAAGEDQRWWWPDALGNGYWPETARREETIDAFIEAYRSIGFEPCADGALQSGIDRIALFAKGGTPTHAARQLPDGHWTSKLGRDIDIAHTLDAISGPAYGDVELYLRRENKGPSVAN